jgi:hypothetical protein
VVFNGIKKYGLARIQKGKSSCSFGAGEDIDTASNMAMGGYYGHPKQYTIWLYRYTRTPPGYTLVVRVGHVVL